MIFITSVMIVIQLLLTILPGNHALVSLNQKLTAIHHTTLPQSYPQLDTIAFVPAPSKNLQAPDPPMQAHAVLLYDIGSAQVLAEREARTRVSIASLTKITTALVILQHHQLDEVVTIPPNLGLPADAESLGVKTGEQFSVREALKATLIYSAGDMAQSLAIWDSGSVAAFADKMNATAKTWGLTDSHFVGPVGLDDANHYSTAYDVLRVTLVALHSETFRSIVNTVQTKVVDNQGKTYTIANTNALLSVPYVYGIKTGTTGDAGEALITLARRNNHELICIVLNSPSRFQESKNMIDWAFANYTWK